MATEQGKLDFEVLYAEDEAVARETLRATLGRRIRSVLTAENGQEGMELYLRHRPPLVITDIRMPVMDGLAMARGIKAADPEAQILVTTAHGDTDYLLEAIEIGVDQYVLKPIDHGKLFAAIDRCLAVVTARTEASRHHEERERLLRELQEALSRVKLLSGMLPICSSCKKIRDDQGYWEQIEVYIKEHSEAEFTHGICPDCVRKLYPEYAQKLAAGTEQPPR
jgi:YesN/AraC family two-component response regulator